MPNAGEDVETQELSSPMVGMQRGAAPLEESVTISYTMRRILTMSSSNHALGIYPKQVRIYVYTKTCT